MPALKLVSILSAVFAAAFGATWWVLRRLFPALDDAVRLIPT